MQKHITNVVKIGRPKKTKQKLHYSATLIFASRVIKTSGKTSIYAYSYYRSECSVKSATGIILSAGEEWDSQNCEVIGNSDKTRILRSLRANYDLLVHELERNGVNFTAQYVMDCFLNKISWKRSASLLDGMNRFVLEIKQPRVESGLIEKDVVNRENRFIKLTKAFIYETYRREDLPFSELNPAFGQRFYVWLQTKRAYAPSFSKKVMQFVKASINYAVSNGWTDRNPISELRWNCKRKAIHALNETDLATLEKCQIPDKKLSICRDVFLFQCYTGFAYVDLANLRNSDLLQTKDGEWYIKKSRQKSNEVSIVPLLKSCIDILHKYKAHAIKTGLLLPILSNQKYNQSLKELAKAVNFNRFPLTTHIARKTCATMLLNNGVPLATVSGVLGHSSSRTTEQFYTTMFEETIVKDVFRIFNQKAV